MNSYHLDLTQCPDPECGAPAEVAHRWTLGSTSGAITMAHTICLRRHIFVLPESWLPGQESAFQAGGVTKAP